MRAVPILLSFATVMLSGGCITDLSAFNGSGYGGYQPYSYYDNCDYERDKPSKRQREMGRRNKEVNEFLAERRQTWEAIERRGREKHQAWEERERQRQLKNYVDPKSLFKQP